LCSEVAGDLLEEFWGSGDGTELLGQKKINQLAICVMNRKSIATCSPMYSLNFSCKEKINIRIILCFIFPLLCDYTTLEILSNDEE